jgi:hypothetical protein
MPEPLLIDIQTILKMVRFISSFRNIFIENKYLLDEDKKDIQEYTKNGTIDSKARLWEFCCIIEHIVEINTLINSWRQINSNFKEIEETIKKTPESEYRYDVIGKVIKSSKYKELIKEMRDNKFHYNGISIINSNNNHLHFFY